MQAARVLHKLSRRGLLVAKYWPMARTNPLTQPPLTARLCAEKSQARLQAEGVSRTVRKHPVTGRWEIAPVLDGRIKRVGGEGSSHGGSVHSGSASGGGGAL